MKHISPCDLSARETIPSAHCKNQDMILGGRPYYGKISLRKPQPLSFMLPGSYLARRRPSGVPAKLWTAPKASCESHLTVVLGLGDIWVAFQDVCCFRCLLVGTLKCFILYSYFNLTVFYLNNHSKNCDKNLLSFFPPRVNTYDCGENVSRWLSKFFGRPCHLIKQSPDFQRNARKTPGKGIPLGWGIKGLEP